MPKASCALCGMTILVTAAPGGRVPICAECFESLPPDPDEVFLTIGFAGPLEDAEDHQARLDAYQAWLQDPDLNTIPDGCAVLGESATLRLAFEHAPKNAAVIAAVRGDEGQLAALALVLRFPLTPPPPEKPTVLVVESSSE